MKPEHRKPKPEWLRRRFSFKSSVTEVNDLLLDLNLHTVCQEAHCPNQSECFGNHTATFMLLGDHCSRNCTFCAVTYGVMEPPDPQEPNRVAEAVSRLDLKYVVLTSVTRDDLADGGASHFAATIKTIRSVGRNILVEVLVPDFKGSAQSLATVVAAQPAVLNHNLETVPRLYEKVRPQADYRRSLDVLANAAKSGIQTKSGLMLGLGETSREIWETLNDLRRADCAYLTLGQYLAPSAEHVPVQRYVPPEEFERWGETSRAMGFQDVASGPLVRSSYRAEELFEKDTTTDTQFLEEKERRT